VQVQQPLLDLVVKWSVTTDIYIELNANYFAFVQCALSLLGSLLHALKIIGIGAVVLDRRDRRMKQLGHGLPLISDITPSVP